MDFIVDALRVWLVVTFVSAVTTWLLLRGEIPHRADRRKRASAMAERRRIAAPGSAGQGLAPHLTPGRRGAAPPGDADR